MIEKDLNFHTDNYFGTPTFLLQNRQTYGTSTCSCNYSYALITVNNKIIKMINSVEAYIYYVY